MKNEARVIDLIGAGKLDGLKSLLAEKPELQGARDGQGISALLLALYRSREDMAALLARGRDDLDWFEAAAMGDAKRLDVLLSDGEGRLNQLSPDGFTALQLAAFFCRTDALRLLLDRGADPRLVSQNGMRLTALHSAAARGSVDAASVLLAAGADVNARQQGGYTALMAAANLGNEAVASRLLRHGADVTMRTEDGKTAATLARAKGFEELARRLES